MHHPFTPDPSIPGVCGQDDCGLPKANRRHASEPDSTPAPIPLRSHDRDHVNVSLDATGSSAAAALRALPGSGTVKDRILQQVLAVGVMHGVTDKELEVRIEGYGPNTLRPRRVDLMQDGWLCPARDEWQDVVTRDGSTAWTLTPAARAKLAEEAA